jgi:MFS family permease
MFFQSSTQTSVREETTNILDGGIGLIYFSGPSANYSLITLVFTLVTGVLLLVVGRLSDIVGRRYFIIGGQLLGIIGSIICAKATSINMVIGGTVLSACAGSVQTLYPLLIQELMPNKHRPWGLAAIALGVFPTIGGGPAIARAFVQHTELSWRYVQASYYGGLC